MNFHIKEQFQQFVLSETTSIRPLPKKVTTKRAPKKDKHIIWSKKRPPSLQEHVESQDPQTQASHRHSTGTNKKYDLGER